MAINAPEHLMLEKEGENTFVMKILIVPYKNNIENQPYYKYKRIHKTFKNRYENNTNHPSHLVWALGRHIRTNSIKLINLV